MIMLRSLYLCACAGLIIAGCGSSLDIPSIEESRKSISDIKPQIDSLDKIIANQTRSLPGGNDLITLTRSSAVNTLLERITNRSLKDIHIDFLSTRPLWKEDKSVLGIGYTNYVDIDTGMLDIDLKKFTFTDFSGNNINAAIEVEGTGTVKASGKYTGVSATVSPQIHFYLNEQIQFTVAAADSDFIRLNPVPKTVLLKTKITVTLLGWNVPYYQEIPLQIADLVKPVSIPSAVRSEIIFPIPAAQYGDRRLDFVRRYLRFTRSSVRAHDGVLEYRSNIDFERE
ncbi:MAG: hypothetical protein WCW40_06020 [Bacteroidota bacterium]